MIDARLMVMQVGGAADFLPKSTAGPTLPPPPPPPPPRPHGVPHIRILDMGVKAAWSLLPLRQDKAALTPMPSHEQPFYAPYRIGVWPQALAADCQAHCWPIPLLSWGAAHS